MGYDMYLKLLSEAVAEEKGEKSEETEEQECLIDLPIEAHIPEDYITSILSAFSIISVFTLATSTPVSIMVVQTKISISPFIS